MSWAQYDLETGEVLATTQRAVSELPAGRGQVSVPEALRVDRIRVNLQTRAAEPFDPEAGSPLPLDE